jgi:hypothetical protein
VKTRKLELKDICGFIPNNLAILVYDNRIVITHYINDKFGKPTYTTIAGENILSDYCKPILRPLSDLYKTITHNGKEIIPIVELAKIAYPDTDWYLTEGGAELDIGYEYITFSFVRNSFSKSNGGVANQVQLFDYLNELKIDYRGLIDAGLAIDCNTLEVNLYN